MHEDQERTLKNTCTFSGTHSNTCTPQTTWSY
jgi:hypothetical protein